MRKGDVCIVDLSLGAGREQHGRRPAIIISEAIAQSIVAVIPLTTNTEALRFPYTLAILSNTRNGLSQESIALVFHIKSVDISRIVSHVGRIDTSIQGKVDYLLKKFLKL